MRPQLKDYAIPSIKEFIRQKVEEGGDHGVVVGLSGGIDSAVTSKLCVEAVGPEKVLNLFMPCKVSSMQDKEDAQAFAESLGTAFKVVDIQPALDAFTEMMIDAKSQRQCMGNIMARSRMIVLYYHANSLDRVVIGTSNKSELLMGYFTKFGDGGADFCPLGDLYKTEVRQLAREIGVPESVVMKAPSAGLWADQTDEIEMGITYEDLDQILFGIERGQTAEQIVEETGFSWELVRMVWDKHIHTAHKRKMPLIPKLGIRTLGLDWRE